MSSVFAQGGMTIVGEKETITLHKGEIILPLSEIELLQKAVKENEPGKQS